MKDIKKDGNLIDVGNVEVYREGRLVYLMQCSDGASVCIDQSNPHKGYLTVHGLQLQIELEKILNNYKEPNDWEKRLNNGKESIKIRVDNNTNKFDLILSIANYDFNNNEIGEILIPIREATYTGGFNVKAGECFNAKVFEFDVPNGELEIINMRKDIKIVKN